MKIVGVDVGGTFTDFHILDVGKGASQVFKLSSTPDNPADAILDGLREIVTRGLADANEIDRICHGTTVATNALIQRKGGRIALVTTEGFRDLLEIGRQTRPHMYDLNLDYPAPLVDRELRLTAPERVDAKGAVIRALTDRDIDEIVEALKASGVRSCAVCLLFSFLNPEHERRLAAAIEAAGIEVSLSSEVQPEFREYERMSTTVLNAYLVPVMNHYLERLENVLADELPEASVGINQSSGGLMSVRQARRFPVRTALSGPAGGVIGAAHVARHSRADNVITLDMGGTSADVCLISRGQAGIAYDRSIGGFPVRLPMVDVNAVGAGGGSIAWFDTGGMLKVGPYSAGAKPGPACYGLGGTEPTVTDANLILGRLSSRGLLAGRVPLEVELARDAFRPIAERLGMSLEHAALGCIDIVVANMVRAIRSVSVERGHDPRDFTLMPFGGGGPLHAEDVARALSIGSVIVPPHPGILCAQGIVVSDLKENMVRTNRMPLVAASVPAIRAVAAELLEESERWFEIEEISPERRSTTLSLDLRYVGQNYELSVEASPERIREIGADSLVDRLSDDFHAIHEANYGHNDPAAAIEVVNFRCVARGGLHRLGEAEARELRTDRPTPRETRSVWFSRSGAVETPIYDRADLAPGHVVKGPAVIEQMDTTTLVHPGTVATMDSGMNLLLELAR
ncbi:hydantoinase/oxoprolinase family protein [Aquibium sp. LZ166]|uniref:Hydantoinase/oxoprolinase family protein n=1 Tax=Aquibium pacificus TaxID=3153579 RepID=A0ABV3SRZ8_9HYPH